MDAAEEIKAFMRMAAQQVYVVTARTAGGEYAAITVSAMTSLSLDPPLIMVAIDKRSRNHDVLMRAEKFVVTLLDARDEWIARIMAEPRDPLSKLKDVGYVDSEDGPLLPGGRPYLVAAKWAAYDGGDHTIFVGRVVGGSVSPVDCPLVYHNRSYKTVSGCAPAPPGSARAPQEA